MANGTWRAFLEQWRRQRLLILGLGVSNRPLARMLLAAGCPGNRLRPDEPGTGGREVLALEELGMELRLGPGYLDGLEADVVFRTPGHAPGPSGAAGAAGPGRCGDVGDGGFLSGLSLPHFSSHRLRREDHHHHADCRNAEGGRQAGLAGGEHRPPAVAGGGAYDAF